MSMRIMKSAGMNSTDIVNSVGIFGDNAPMNCICNE
jgi:hypothetical protein